MGEWYVRHVVANMLLQGALRGSVSCRFWSLSRAALESPLEMGLGKVRSGFKAQIRGAALVRFYHL
jgi:hypothetical protein